MIGSRWILALALLCMATRAHSLEAIVSYAVFHKYSPSGTDSAFLEIYWQVNPSSLHYHKNDNGELVTKIQTVLRLDKDSTAVARERYELNTKPFVPGQAAQTILDIRRYPVPTGKLSLDIYLGETEFPKQMFHTSLDINIRSANSPHFSTVQLLDTFFVHKGNGAFNKDGYMQLPRTLNFYDEGQRLIHFYAEQYNLDKASGEGLVQHFFLSKQVGDFAIARFQIIDTITNANRLQKRHHTFDASTLPSGNYYINSRLKSQDGKVLDTQSVFFQIINKKPDMAPVVAEDTGKVETTGTYFDMSKTFVGKFSMRQLMAILKMISPNADHSEGAIIRSFQKKPDEVYIRYFIYNYFSKNNKAHPEDEWKKFSAYIREINRQFDGGGKMGYETDRGIVYMKYGKPDELVRVPNEAGALPYEIWRYNTVGNTNQRGTFVFYQAGFTVGDFRYLTSNVTGELQNPAWRNVLYSSGNTSGSGNSRAAEYLEGK